MSSWGIAEWYGHDIRTMSGEDRFRAANIALSEGTADAPECPYLTEFSGESTTCSKKGGVCSIRQFDSEGSILNEQQPAVVCPNRFLGSESVNLSIPNGPGESVFAFIAREFFLVETGAKVIKEVPFLYKVDADGSIRSGKAGRIDWIVVPTPPTDDIDKDFNWIAVETQAVYFSGGSMDSDFRQYREDPDTLHAPTVLRRPDYRSSGAKRLAPQLSVKSPVMRRWGKKVAVVVDQSFFNELAQFKDTVEDLDNSEVIWIIMSFTDEMRLQAAEIVFAELDTSIEALQATRPMVKSEFEASLGANLIPLESNKVYDA